ncbi:MAG: hypothetical protein M3O55_00560 [Actinomycetota bacterium]|nr:hypothetical protein [Actinomycetota bacterium]
MTRRCALLLWPGAAPSAAAPPGIDPVAYAGALFEDVAEVLHGLAGVDTLVVCPAGESSSAGPFLWPDVPVVESAPPSVRAAVRIAQERGYDHAAVVAADAPDLPQLVLAKVFQALAGSPVVVAGAEPAGAVAVGVALPAPAWLPLIDIDDRAVIEGLRAAASDPAQVELTPGWHRMRGQADVHRLDPGLEGWEATRRLLGGLRSPQGA